MKPGLVVGSVKKMDLSLNYVIKLMAGIARDIAFTISENREQNVYIKYGNVSLPSIAASSFSTA